MMDISGMAKKLKGDVFETSFLAAGRSREKTDLFMKEHMARLNRILEYRKSLGITGDGTVTNGECVVGFLLDATDTIPEGWGRHKKHPEWAVPRGQTQTARKARKALADLSVRLPRFDDPDHGLYVFATSERVSGFVMASGVMFDTVSFYTIGAFGAEQHHILAVRHERGTAPPVPLDSVPLRQSQVWALKEAAGEA